MGLRDEVISDAHSKKSEICPVHCVEVFPSFYVTVDESSDEKIHHESDCLKHQCTLAESQPELLLVVTQVCADDGGDHEERYDTVKSRGNNGIIKGLRKGMLLRRT